MEKREQCEEKNLDTCSSVLLRHSSNKINFVYEIIQTSESPVTEITGEHGRHPKPTGPVRPELYITYRYTRKNSKL